MPTSIFRVARGSCGDNITAYDAMSGVLAEALEAPLVTRDGPLAKAPRHRARIDAID